MSAPVPIFGTQDLHDDDGQVIDSFFIETDTPPDLKLAEQPIVVPARPDIKVPTRLLAGTETLNSTMTPYMLLPEDVNRLEFHLDIYSFAATPGTKDFVYVADEAGKIASVINGASRGALKARYGKSVTLDNHTGAIWICPGPILTDNIEVTWRAVIK